jgi:hypothetical protein
VNGVVLLQTTRTSVSSTPYVVVTEISETPNIVEGLDLPIDFAGDAMLQLGEDDLQTLQQNPTDLQ